MRQKICILPRLHDYSGDMNQQWFVYYSYRDPRTDKMVRFRTSKGFARLKSAKARYKAAQKLIEELTYKLRNCWNPFEDDSQVIYNDHLKYAELIRKEGSLRSGNKTLDYFMSKYLEERKPTIAHSTYKTYQSKFRIFMAFLQKKKETGNDISAFGEKMAAEFMEHLFEIRKIKNKMANQYILLFKMFFRWLIKKGDITFNPFENMQYYKATSRPAKYFQQNTLEAVKRTILENDPQLWTIAQFQFYCFIRPIELRKMKLKDINMRDGTITVPAEIAKNRKEQTVIMPEPFLESLKTLSFESYPDNNFVITKKGVPGKDPVGKNYMWNHFNKIRKKMNLSNEYKLYSFKHTGNVMAARKGIGLKDLQMQNRHHSLDQMDIYLRQMLGNESEGIRNNYPVI